MTFSDLGLVPDVLRAISDCGYDTPTPIQEQAIPVVLMGRDVLGSAQTGTGKTAGFTLPMIDILASARANARMARSLIIEPTRELAAQVAESFDRYDLATRIGLSEASVKRLFSRQTFTLNRLQQVLKALDMDFFELARPARGAGDAPQEMTEAQEQALASEPQLMGIFYLLFNDWQPAQILARYEITEAELTRWLARLDRLHLIDLHPANRAKLKVSRHLRLKPSGAIRARHGQRTMTEFLSVEFDRHGGHFLFQFRDISAATSAADLTGAGSPARTSKRTNRRRLVTGPTPTSLPIRHQRTLQGYDR